MYYKPVEYGSYNPTLADVEKMGLPIFNDWWSTYIPEYKQELMTKILRHYHFNQIGAETPERFIYYLNTQLAEIMPYYNQLYKSELIKFNPLLNHSIEANGRSIENILTKANTTDDKFSKAIRDFIGQTDKSGNVKATENMVAVGDKDYSESTDYNKDGTTNEKAHTENKGTEDETIDDTKKVVEHDSGNTTQKTDTTTTGTDDKTVTETPGEKVVKGMQWGGTQDTTIKKDEKTTSKTDGSKHWKEVTDDDSTTKVVTDLDENSTMHRQQDYADTPQKQLDTKKLRNDYLTNVTWVDENSQHKADTTQDTTFADDMSKTHDETYHETGAGTKINADTESLKKGGTDTETTTHSGTNKTVTDDDTSSTTKGTVKTDHDDWKTTDTTDKEVRDLDTTSTTDSTVDKPWEEKGHSETTGAVDTKDTTDKKANTDSISAEKSREVSDLSQSSTNNVNKHTEETTDSGSTNVTQGFMNVSPSALLEAFRRTFLNIDQMIIEELKTNFMLVY